VAVIRVDVRGASVVLKCDVCRTEWWRDYADNIGPVIMGIVLHEPCNLAPAAPEPVVSVPRELLRDRLDLGSVIMKNLRDAYKFGAASSGDDQ